MGRPDPPFLARGDIDDLSPHVIGLGDEAGQPYAEPHVTTTASQLIKREALHLVMRQDETGIHRAAGLEYRAGSPPRFRVTPSARSLNTVRIGRPPSQPTCSSADISPTERNTSSVRRLFHGDRRQPCTLKPT
ncbi:hypothetical protein Airi01_081400 [Actinoallomurus iriomotensis]|uniref:Uncharacterized protein n=1 Tax=Actinoallomurus iriomotensis TaxID=478107 RepID=A0A9W6RQF3_9ACTN|nr:hypothetical protein Airi01_081400 [Actinoallomurus iriomotensis]